MQIYMAALKPPGNVDALLRPTQDALFRDRGWASVRALLPILPVAYALDEGDLPPAPTGTRELVIGGLDIDSTHISVSIAAGVQEALVGEDSGRKLVATVGPGSTLPRPGVLFLAVNEERLSAEQLSDLPEPAETRVRQWWHVVLELEFEDAARWWHSLNWRECDSTRLRKRG